MTKHYLIGGSTAKRTLNCSQWYYKSKNLPAVESSAAADVGTLCHLAMQKYYDEGLEFSELVDKLKYKGYLLSEYYVNTLLKPAVHMVDTLVDKENITQAFFEITHEYNKYIGGTADILALSEDKKTLFIIDYKFGSHNVNVKENKQLYTYAFLALSDEKLRGIFEQVIKVKFVIIQPKISKKYKIYETTKNNVLMFAKLLITASLNLFNPEALALEKGGWCFFCPAKIKCDNEENNLRKNKLAETLNII